MKPTFILGMGAPKAGTSWLHNTLSKNDNVNLGFTKEYHIWDYVFSDLCAEFKAPVKKPDKPGAAMRRMMQAFPAVYTKYFQGLINSNVNVTGDITPSYSMINQQGLQQISGILGDAGFDVKVVFLMRDPIDRIWSAVRMERRNILRTGHKLDDAFCEERVREYLGIKSHVARSDYKTSVQNITKVFAKDKIYFELYESLFQRKSIDNLEDFLGFPLNNVDFSERVNQSPEEQLSQKTIDLLFDFFAPQYEFCKDNFAEVNGLWRDLV